jgi:hypothetical protein
VEQWPWFLAIVSETRLLSQRQKKENKQAKESTAENETMFILFYL